MARTFSPKITCLKGWHPQTKGIGGLKAKPDQHRKYYYNGLWARIYRAGYSWVWQVCSSPWFCEDEEKASGTASHCSTAMIKANIAAYTRED